MRAILAETDKIGVFAKIGCEMIELQLTLASKETSSALTDLWALGYCFGVFDAMGQRAKLDQHTDGFSLITVGFFNLMSGPEPGGERLRVALDNQTNPLFISGNRTGGSDVFAWFSDQNKQPTGLVKYLTRSIRTPLPPR
jgi:hypothetical protein